MPNTGFNGQKLNKDHPIKVEWATGTTIAPEPEISLWDEDPVWRMGSPTSSANLRPTLQSMVHRSSPKLPSSPSEIAHQSPPLPTIGSPPSGWCKDTSPSTTTSQPIEIGDRSPVEDPRDYPDGRRELSWRLQEAGDIFPAYSSSDRTSGGF